MIKKIGILFIVLAATFYFALSLFAHRAPGLLREALQKSLNKKVNIKSIRYDFPGSFRLEAFEIEEDKPFDGEISFYADRILLQVSPLSLARRELIIDRIEVENAKVFLRHWQGRLTHSLSSVTSKSTVTPSGAGTETAAEKSAKTLPLEIKRFRLTGSEFKYIDLDIQQGGFVIAFDEIKADLRDIRLPPSKLKTRYKIDARLLQGRDERPATLHFEGVTRFADLETDARWDVRQVRLPYFKPYYETVTPALIEQGVLESRAVVRVEQKDLTANINLELSELAFGAYEAENELFGLNANEILSFLKDSSGRLKFQTVLRWNLADRSVRVRDVIRRGIERSLKETVVGSVGKILKNAIQKIGEQGVEKGKEDLETKIKKLKQEWINF